MVFKKIAIFAILLIAGALGVGIPMLGKSIPALSPEKDVSFIIKAFAAGVILATGLIHVLLDAFDSLTSPCLEENPWGNFPFAGFVDMVSAIGTSMVDAYATGHYTRSHFGEAKKVNGGGFVDEERVIEHTGHAHLHTHASHGHTHGSVGSTHDSSASELIRHRVISQVLELSIVVHSAWDLEDVLFRFYIIYAHLSGSIQVTINGYYVFLSL
ncbi:hypothetical protein MRB53_024110 [Persea americana]|uniref:Uncharacterized protein n=1 Tax=Persea americana TaxID=3435 RepID=A0ACC2LBR9_PERAE|nr:hypothetical protein MRB53_024110 [Persea americana]